MTNLCPSSLSGKTTVRVMHTCTDKLSDSAAGLGLPNQDELPIETFLDGLTKEIVDGIEEDLEIEL